jgi:hypothetical protein
MALPPYATKPNPIIAPTTLCVDDTGSFAAVAIISHNAPPDNALKDPRSTSFSVSFRKQFVSTILLRIVSENNFIYVDIGEVLFKAVVGLGFPNFGKTEKPVLKNP